MPISLETLLIPRDNILHAAVTTEEAVMMNIDAGKYYGLNAVAMRIWELLIEGPKTVSQLRQQISNEFEIDMETCESDVLKFANMLIENGIVYEATANLSIAVK